jgi:hypothetical protein
MEDKINFCINTTISHQSLKNLGFNYTNYHLQYL